MVDKSFYKRWTSMIQRCSNPNNPAYRRYGGRGIKVCNRWLDFLNFCKDMSKTYKPELTIDRINNDGNYEKANCRWVTRKENNNNRAKHPEFVNYSRAERGSMSSKQMLTFWSKLNKEQRLKRIMKGVSTRNLKANINK